MPRCLATKKSEDAVCASLRELETATVAQLSARCGLSRPTVQQVLNQLHDAGMVHIHDSIIAPRSYFRIKVWALGPGKDADPAPLLTEEQRRERKKQQRIESADRRSLYEELAHRERVAAELASFVPFRDPLTAAFFGEYRGRAAA